VRDWEDGGDDANADDEDDGGGDGGDDDDTEFADTGVASPGIAAVDFSDGSDAAGFLKENVLNKWRGANWWWKQMVNPKGNWLRAFVMFGDREFITPEMDEQGEPVFRKVVDKIVLSHTIKSDTKNGRAYRSAKVDVWFRHTRGSLLPAVLVA
jgi:hypothetical protein